MENKRYRGRESYEEPESGITLGYTPGKEDQADAPSLDDGIQRRKMVNIVRILLGIAVILVCVSLLIGLIGWVKQDIANSVLFLQSGIQ